LQADTQTVQEPGKRATRTLFEPGRNCWRVARADRAAFLIDADNYFRAFAHAALKATRSIVILAWDFDSRVPLQWEGRKTPPNTLGAFLNYLVHKRRGLHIHILDWDYPMIFGTDREFPPLYSLGWTPARHVHLRYDNTHPVGGSHHQKVVVIDDNLAFCGGIDLTGKRWDTCDHRADDSRRVACGEPYPPFHDCMAMVEGEAARELGVLVRERWHLATGEALSPLPADLPSAWPEHVVPDLTDVPVAISRTIPESQLRPEVREIEALYVDMIARARRCIYIENQYFTAHKVADALAARLAEEDGPEIVLVVRLLSHGWLEEHTMEVLRTRLIRRLKEADRHGRFGVYYPDVPGLKEGTCVDVHSKVMVIDEECLRIGSANLCNRSLGLDTECDLAIEAAGEPHIAEAIRDFRNTLAAEHLGASPQQVQEEYERSGSLNATIGKLGSGSRTLKPLTELKEWPDVVVDLAELADPEKPVSMDQMIDQFAPNIVVEPPPRRWVALLATIVAVAGLAAIWRFTPLAELASADRVVRLAETFAGHWWAPLVVVLAYTPASLVMFPRPLITLFAVVAFGAALGFFYAMTGVLLAAGATYFAGRKLDRDKVRRFAGDKLNYMGEVLRHRGLMAVTALRLVPLAPFAVEGLVAGAIRIKAWHLLAGTFIGMLPGTLATTVFGHQLQTALHDPKAINYWLLFGVTFLLVVGALAVRRWLFGAKISAA
jgi:phosphatidylserine/phosphatidylglycerophosphate/cardiolipin synthase-like enzyme/uncharacterized membrane protein YdjX (TVP38/TMEM64 family)